MNMTELTKSQRCNLAEFIEMNIFDMIRGDEEIDSINWLIDMMEIYKMAQEEK